MPRSLHCAALLQPACNLISPMKKLCSSCTSWLEPDWSYCIYCGSRRHSPSSSCHKLSASLDHPSSSTSSEICPDLDESTILAYSPVRKLKANTKPRTSLLLSLGPAKVKPRALKPRLRQNGSIHAHHQLQQWRKKLCDQEHLLDSLEKSNIQSQRSVSEKSTSDLRHTIGHGRNLVRNWSSSSSSQSAPSPLKSLKPSETNTKRPRRRLPKHPSQNTVKKRPDGDSGNNQRTCQSATTSCVQTFVDRILGEGHKAQRNQHHQEQWAAESGNDNPFSSSASYIRAMGDFAAPRSGDSLVPLAATNGGTVPQGSSLEQLINGTIADDACCLEQQRNTEKQQLKQKEHQQQQAGWFWGAGDTCGVSSKTDSDGVVDTNFAAIRQPGHGAVGAFWRTSGTDNRSTRFASSQATLSSSSQHQRSSVKRNDHDPASFLSDDCCSTYSRVAGIQQGNVSCNRSGDDDVVYPAAVLIEVASSKAANRSARNRAAELDELLSSWDRSGRYGASREECLAKAESSVRASQAAISCANKRLFELELQVGAGDVGEHGTEEGEGEKSDDNHDLSIASKISSLSSQAIKQLAEQLEIAQTLQAAAVAASANTKSLFACYDAAATVLQAGARIMLKRRLQAQHSENKARTAFASTTVDSDNIDHHHHHHPLVPQTLPKISQDENLQNDINDTTAMLPREERGWWTFAETEDREETETSMPGTFAIVKSVVKLQALVRSMLARKTTFAAVNARFVEHFDEGFQHPFYVCLDTHRSQWNRPFGFGVVADGAPGVTRNNNEELEPSFAASRNEGEYLEDDGQTAAAVVIQCAVRAAQARQRLAELIVFNSLEE